MDHEAWVILKEYETETVFEILEVFRLEIIAPWRPCCYSSSSSIFNIHWRFIPDFPVLWKASQGWRVLIVVCAEPATSIIFSTSFNLLCVCLLYKWNSCLEHDVDKRRSRWRSLIRIGSSLTVAANTMTSLQPKKNLTEGTHRYDLLKHASATLGSGADLREAVQLPDGEDLNEWVAVHIVDFFNQISMLYGTITEFCTSQRCPLMSAGPKYEYHWADGQTVKKPIKCSAPQVYTNSRRAHTNCNKRQIRYLTYARSWCLNCFVHPPLVCVRCVSEYRLSFMHLRPSFRVLRMLSCVHVQNILCAVVGFLLDLERLFVWTLNNDVWSLL